MIEAVVFDVGETLVDETRAWGRWADHLGIPRLTFFAVLGSIIADGGSHREVFERFRPGIDLAAESRRMGVAGISDLVSLDDLYPDALAALREVAGAGYRVGLAGNQPAPAAEVLRQLDVPLDLVATSEAWGVAKPDGRFFDRIVDELALPAGRIAYVGDRLDNDIRPARAAGMAAIWIRRGPWAWAQVGRGRPPEATAVIERLTGLPAVLAALPEAPPIASG
jgi:HAD superfamily hydrolase (TIGR01662 family)